MVLSVTNLPPAAEVAAIVMSIDGVMVRMKDAPNTPGAHRDDEGPKGHREAASATVALYDADGNRLYTVYLARMPEHKKRVLHQQLLAEVQWMLQRYPTAKLVALADGARENWRILTAIEKSVKRKAIHLVDFYHAAEHLQKGLAAAGVSAAEIDTWKRRLLTVDGGPKKCLDELNARLKKMNRRSTKFRAALAEEVTYFTNNCERMGYTHAEALCLPVGSGVQEAACKTLVCQRMKNSGMSWLTPGGQAILTFRSIQHCGRTKHAWAILRTAIPANINIDNDVRRQAPRLAA
jgi:hypothetical protein